MKYNFTELTKGQLQFIEDIKIDEHFVSEEHIEQIERMLDLNNIYSEIELRGVRNTVVRHLNEVFDEVMEDYEKGRQILTNISGITCVIDHRLWNLGYMV